MNYTAYRANYRTRGNDLSTNLNGCQAIEQPEMELIFGQQ
jgi:hypothetical protein